MAQHEDQDTIDLRLRESEQRYQAVIENASDMIQSVRPDGTFEFVNRAWHDVLGYTDDDLATMTIWEIIAPEAMAHCQVEFGRAIQGKAIDFLETVFVASDGRHVPVEGSVTSRMVGEQVVATHGFFRDISERLHAQELEARAATLEREERARYLEKMAALGKLSAGLAHELNNPAAAIQRAAAGLRETIERRDSAMRALHEANIDPEAWSTLQELLDAAPTSDAPSDALDVSLRESELETWLEDHDIDRAWTLAPALAEGGLDEAALARAADSIPADALSCGLTWIAETLAVREATEIVAQSGARISDLVTAIKGYSHMDRASEAVGDIHDGIETTLVILGHRLRNVRVEREFDRRIPPVRMFGNTLNQVWTNLLDNAIDAMDGQGSIRIRSRHEDNHVVVEIEDSGDGIPPEALPRIFEPFYTSKPQGVGTGLGLDTVWRIVTEQHGGSVTAESEPGRTVFRVALPITDTPPETA